MSHDIEVPNPPNGTYRHSKSGKLYEVIGVALHTETSELQVVYRPLYEHDFGYDLFTRPYEMFIEVVEVDGKPTPRFEKVND